MFSRGNEFILRWVMESFSCSFICETTAIAGFQFLHWSSISSYVRNDVYKCSVLEAARRRYIAVKAGCVVRVGLHLRTRCSQWINNSLVRKPSLCVHVRKWVQHFMDSLGTPRRAELISYLFEVCLNLQSIPANNKKVLKCSWSTTSTLYLNRAIM